MTDPIELAVFQNVFHSIAEEMGAALRRTAFSPNIKERRDYSSALFDAEGNIIAMGDDMPVHLGSMPMSVRAAVEKIISAGRKPRGIRLDSGDLAADSAWARARLNQAGWKDVIVFASGDLDEERISSLLREGAKIDGFGVGTALVTSNDSPTLGVIYKLVEIEIGGEVRSAAKFSAAKVTYPARKQVHRFSHPDGNFECDVIGLAEENFPGAAALLEPVMEGGKRTVARTDLEAAGKRCLQQRARLPETVRDLRAQGAAYPVRHSEKLEALLEEVRRRVQHAAGSWM